MNETKRPDEVGIPRWLVLVLGLFIWLVVIPFIHGVVPWAISLLTTRCGWTEGRPGTWNLLGRLPVALAIACFIGIMVMGFARVPELPERVKLEMTPQFLVTRGPYAFSRNPMYVAVLALWLGWVLFYGSVAVLIGVPVLWALVTFILVPHEERALEARFGEAYRQYKSEVPRWLGKTHR